MKKQCVVYSTEEQKKGMREERSGAVKWEPCNSHDSWWEDCLETRVVTDGHRESIPCLYLKYLLSVAV